LTSESGLVTYLPWDSEFFGFPIARANVKNIDSEQLAQINAECAEQDIRCLYFLVEPDTSTTGLLESNGFHWVDLRYTLDADLNSITFESRHASIRNADVGDVEQLRQIAAGNHTDSRFYHDGHFPVELCNELYAIWIEKCVRDPKELVLVWEEEAIVAGYVTAKVHRGIGEVGLVGVHPEFRGRGIAGTLTRALLQQLNDLNAEGVIVVTQGRNIAAQRLYQSCGFRSKTMELWYHKWFE